MSWPHGGGVDLLVRSGERYVLLPNNIPSFKSVTIESGADFIVGTDFFASNPWAVIGCFHHFILKGTLWVRGSPIHDSQAYPLVAPDGVQHSASFVQPSGGNGGGAYATPQVPGGVGGVTAAGNGGGGAAPFGRGANADVSRGGDGGTATFPPNYPSDRWSKGGGGMGGTVSTNESVKSGGGGPGGDGNGGRWNNGRWRGWRSAWPTWRFSISASAWQLRCFRGLY